MNEERTYVLAMACPDSSGIVVAVSGFFAEHGGWIVESNNHADREANRFFMREQVLASSLPFEVDELRDRFAPIADRFEMEWKITDSSQRKRIAVLVSHEEHCLYDLLGRYRSSELPAEIVAVVANHSNLEDVVTSHRIPFHLVPVASDTREKDLDRLTELLTDLEVDTIVLARYMQILPRKLCEQYPGRIINIHHGFLPSFKGARPYHQAHERGVKLIGATCHYVTPDLDEGPIIEQDVVRVDHSDSIGELVRAGKDVEKAVLARGLRYHLEDRVLLDGNRTIVFR